MAVRSEGRSAQTHFWVLERFGDWTLVDALLLTGRTHQLRVHFASIGHPVAGDITYGPSTRPPGLERQFVHARLLRLTSPHDQLEHTFEAPIPPDLSLTLERLRRRSIGTRNPQPGTR
jgi:23S rRNA pseudouridine1911/1915/1917 synthase